MTRANHHQPTATHVARKKAGVDNQPIAIRDCHSGQRYELGPTRRDLMLGGDNRCDIVLTDRYASASHCTISRISGRWLLRDHGSKNGTMVDGTLVRIAELRGGSQIVIGESRLEVLSGENSTHGLNLLIGKAPLFVLAVNQALRAAKSTCPVLLLGETGTGKELMARTIHDASRRSTQSFVPVNCGAIPANLVRSELFGHAKGAFTGAVADHDGLFTQADGGTIFLDELGELPAEQQPLLLRALESGLIRRVGGAHEELVNTRFVSATNRDCLDDRNSPLRSDLFHRVSTIIIELPPLRRRCSDIPLLIRHFLAQGEQEYGPRRVKPGTLQELTHHRWSGNIRELRNAVSRALALGSGHLGTEDFLPGGIVSQSQPLLAEAHSTIDLEALSAYQRNQRLLLLGAYEQHRTIRRAAQELGLPKSTFADMCRRYDIRTSRKKRGSD